MYTGVDIFICLYRKRLLYNSIQMYQQQEDLTRFIGRVTTLGKDRFVITVPKEDNPSVEHLKGKRVFVIVKDANEPLTEDIESSKKSKK